jgi:hypothetical protein
VQLVAGINVFVMFGYMLSFMHVEGAGFLNAAYNQKPSSSLHQETLVVIYDSI